MLFGFWLGEPCASLILWWALDPWILVSGGKAEGFMNGERVTIGHLYEEFGCWQFGENVIWISGSNY